MQPLARADVRLLGLTAEILGPRGDAVEQRRRHSSGGADRGRQGVVAAAGLRVDENHLRWRPEIELVDGDQLDVQVDQYRAILGPCHPPAEPDDDVVDPVRSADRLERHRTGYGVAVGVVMGEDDQTLGIRHGGQETLNLLAHLGAFSRVE